MKFKTLKSLLAVAAITISGGLATQAASAAQLTPTEVTIEGTGGDYFGYVKSSDEENCESGRKVTVFKMLGSSPSRSVDQKIGSDIASPNGPDAMWSIGNSGYKKGKFYARTGKTPYCGGDTSPVIKGQP
jgi:ABC-type glycerol-3-phosphate transport system substrate-binding protein